MPGYLSLKFLYLVCPGHCWIYYRCSKNVNLLAFCSHCATSQGLFLHLLPHASCPGEERLSSPLVLTSLFSMLLFAPGHPSLVLFQGFFSFSSTFPPFRGENFPFNTTFLNRWSLASVHFSSTPLQCLQPGISPSPFRDPGGAVCNLPKMGGE